jgi:hypothetical protein
MKNNFVKNVLLFSCIILIIGMLFAPPYWYYQLLRWIIAFSAGYTASIFHSEKKLNWMYTMVVITICYNPIQPFYFGKELWTIINILTIVLFASSCYFLKTKNHLDK